MVLQLKAVPVFRAFGASAIKKNLIEKMLKCVDFI
jgi:hypothetical protein